LIKTKHTNLLFLAKNCTEDPVIAPNNDKGMFDWDLSVRNKSYSLQINYWYFSFTYVSVLPTDIF
jgi:hypothetical protein